MGPNTTPSRKTRSGLIYSPHDIDLVPDLDPGLYVNVRYDGTGLQIFKITKDGVQVVAWPR